MESGAPTPHPSLWQATCPQSTRAKSDGRDTAVAELKAERVEHEACRLQLISAQAALQRTRADTSETIATEGVRLTLCLDELRRADRLAGVIHRSLHDAMRGAAESAGLLLPDAPGPQYAMKTAPALLPPPSVYSGGGGGCGPALNSTSAVGSAMGSSRNSTSALSFAQTPITRRGGSPPPGSSRPPPGSTRPGMVNTGPTVPPALEMPSTGSSPTAH